ncbi:MAG: 4-hydroxy-tetrahydrodipicolinate reductase [Pseudomonadota bacterium]
MLKVCISGATGWTGKELVRGVVAASDLQLVSAVARQTAGTDIGAAIGDAVVGVTVTDSLADALDLGCDVLIDYTHPDQRINHTLLALSHRIPVVLGTTGLSAAEIEEIDIAARTAGVGVVTGNFSLTAALAQHFALFAAQHIDRFEIIDYAKADKPDSPSGTAGELAELLGDIRQPTLDIAIADTHGPDSIRGATVNGVQVHAVRLPSYTLAVESIFAQQDERLVIRHEAGGSAVPYVFGTLLAARKIPQIVGVVRGLDKLLFTD